jgi:photosystem II stability/assembly factor-like uncharacterized protein
MNNLKGSYNLSIGLLLIFFLLIIACNDASKINTKVGKEVEPLAIQHIDTFSLNASIRALEVVNDQTVWFAGSGGQFGYTEDGGNNWIVDSIKTDTIIPHFRAISVTDEAVFLLSIASPALLYRSVDKGANWEIVYREDHKAAFYDAMAFWDDKEGIAMGDPTDGCLSVIITRDGGNSWEKIDCSKLPASEEGEAAFAASNSNIALVGDHAWIVSGGKKSRVFHSADRGRSWEVFDTPIISGEQMTGIFTSDFWDEKTGVVFGGNWETMDRNTANKAITEDGGKTWRLLADGQHPGYRSCVQYAPDGGGEVLMVVGIPGISYSKDGGESWEALSDENFYTLRFGSTMKTAWVAGSNKVGKIVFDSGEATK